MTPRLTCAVPLLVLVVYSLPSHAQLTGEQGELTRLQTQAEDSMAQGDPQGAAISMGKAALLAAQLSTQRLPKTDQQPYQLMADLFRTQEQVYRAIALFQQSGEQIPASSGVCRLLALGGHHVALALKNGPALPQNASLHEQTTEWLEIVQELQQEWACRK